MGGSGSGAANLEPMPVLPSSRLLPTLRAKLRTKRYSERTVEAYGAWVRRYVKFHGMRHPSELGPREVEAFLTDLATRSHVASATQNQALAAIMFLYREVFGTPTGWLDGMIRAKRPQRLPVVLTREEVAQVLSELRGTSWTLAMLMYGGGLRVSEACGLRVKDLDLGERRLTVRHGKGGKDRVTMVPEVLVGQLERQIENVRILHARDVTSRRAAGRSRCLGRWPASHRRRRGTGGGCGCFRRRGGTSRAARAGRCVTTCTRRWCSGRCSGPVARREFRSG